MSLAVNGYKECNCCKIIKPITEYWKDSTKHDKLATYCNTCKMRAYNENKPKARELAKIRSRKLRLNNPVNNMISLAKTRAKKRGLPFNLEVSDVVIPDYCSILNVVLKVGTERVESNSPSLDRIIPSLGYVKGNVQVISHKANTMKSNATITELLLFADWIYKMYGDQRSEVTNTG
jgi:hypothetical protein